MATFTQIESSCPAPATIANHYILVYAKPLRGQENYFIIKVNYNTIFKVYNILGNLAICKHGNHHAFPGNGRQFWSSSLLLLIASEVADFLITCFCFTIIVFVGKEELSNLFVTRSQTFRIQNLAEYIWDLPCIKGQHFLAIHYARPRLRVSLRAPIMSVFARLRNAEIKKRAFQSKSLH